MNMFARHSWDDRLRHDTARQVAELRHQVDALAATVERAGSHLQHDAGHLGEAVWHGGAELAHELSRQSRRALRAVRKDPTPAVATLAALVGIGAFLGLLLTRR